jgi:hypothetical protein
MEKEPLNNSVKFLFTAGLAVLAIVSSCSKSGPDCFTSTGSITRESRHADDFDTIVANNNVDIILTQDTVNSVEVEAGKNIIDGILTEVADRQLTISNTNTCNWVRSYDKPLNVYVHVKNLRKIYYLSAGNISTTNTITAGSLMVDVWGGCGAIDMNVDLGQGEFYEHMGTADIIIRGKAVSISVASGDFGLLQLKDLKSDFTYVANTGSNDCYVHAEKYLDATIQNIGNIYYSGSPDTVRTHISGTGSLIHL